MLLRRSSVAGVPARSARSRTGVTSNVGYSTRNVPPRDLPSAAPDQTPLTAVGRLLRDDAIPEYEQAYQNLVQKGEAVPAGDHLWVLLDGSKPRSGLATPAAIAGLCAVLGWNVFTLVRYFRARAARAKSKK